MNTRTLYIAATIALSINLIQFQNAQADVGEVPSPGGLITPGDKTSEISMKKEKVVFRVSPPVQKGEGKYVYTTVSAHVTADFVMNNLTNHDISKRLFFPLHVGFSTEDYSQSEEAKTVKIMINGQIASHALEDMAIPTKYGNQGVASATFDASFPALQDTAIKVEYDAVLTEDPKSNSRTLLYLMETGSHWAGPIGSGEIIYDLWQDIDTLTIFTRVNNFFKIENGNLVWKFSNLEPAPEHNIDISLNPDIVEAWNNRPSYLANLQDGPNSRGDVYVFVPESDFPVYEEANPINLLDITSDYNGWIVKKSAVVPTHKAIDWLEFQFKGIYKVGEISIRAGILYDADPENGAAHYKLFDRPKTVQITYPDNTIQTLTLADKPNEFQSFALLDKPSDRIRLVFNGFYPGTNSDYFGVGRIKFDKVASVPTENSNSTNSTNTVAQAAQSKSPFKTSKLILAAILISLLATGTTVYLKREYSRRKNPDSSGSGSRE